MANAARKQQKPEHHEIAITRIVNATPDKVFKAWLQPGHLSRWWGPREGLQDFSTPHVEVDPKPGGIFRTCIRSPRGDEYWARGVFTEIDPPRRLGFTHGWENEDGKSGHERLVTVEFAATVDKTRLSFRIGGFESIESYDSEVEGWNECMDRLVQCFADGRQASANRKEAQSFMTPHIRSRFARSRIYRRWRRKPSDGVHRQVRNREEGRSRTAPSL